MTVTHRTWLSCTSKCKQPLKCHLVMFSYALHTWQPKYVNSLLCFWRFSSLLFHGPSFIGKWCSQWPYTVCFHLLSYYLIRVAKGQKSNTNNICLLHFVRFPETSSKQSCVPGFKRRPVFLQCAHGRQQKRLHLLCPLPTHSDYPTETANHCQRAGQ